MASEFLLTSESVGEGHPDKVADRISDAVLDWYLARDPHARVACETLVTQNYVCIAGEVRSSAGVDAAAIERSARAAITDIGYVEDDGRFCAAQVPELSATRRPKPAPKSQAPVLAGSSRKVTLPASPALRGRD